MTKPALSIRLVAPLIALFWFCVSMHGSRQDVIPTYRSSVRLVEVYVTVLDNRSKYVSGLTQDRFEIFDEGIRCPITDFDPVTSNFSCAMLLDRTGSMLAAMPALKNATLRFIDSFRENDSFAVYAFSTSLVPLQEFTQDKNAAKQAVLRTIAHGATALYDSLSEVTARLSTRKGKKLIVVMTDGDDNSSYLTSSAVIRKAKFLGIPIYAVAQGEALSKKDLMKTLKELARATGASCHAVQKGSEIEEVFQDIAADIQHSYLIAYAPPEANDARYRSIRVNVAGMKNLRIRAREGYYLK
jgi:VWFA-related protein